MPNGGMIPEEHLEVSASTSMQRPRRSQRLAERARKQHGGAGSRSRSRPATLATLSSERKHPQKSGRRYEYPASLVKQQAGPHRMPTKTKISAVVKQIPKARSQPAPSAESLGHTQVLMMVHDEHCDCNDCAMALLMSSWVLTKTKKLQAEHNRSGLKDTKGALSPSRASGRHGESSSQSKSKTEEKPHDPDCTCPECLRTVAEVQAHSAEGKKKSRRMGTSAGMDPHKSSMKSDATRSRLSSARISARRSTPGTESHRHPSAASSSALSTRSSASGHKSHHPSAASSTALSTRSSPSRHKIHHPSVASSSTIINRNSRSGIKGHHSSAASTKTVSTRSSAFGHKSHQPLVASSSAISTRSSASRTESYRPSAASFSTVSTRRSASGKRGHPSAESSSAVSTRRSASGKRGHPSAESSSAVSARRSASITKIGRPSAMKSRSSWRHSRGMCQ